MCFPLISFIDPSSYLFESCLRKLIMFEILSSFIKTKSHKKVENFKFVQINCVPLHKVQLTIIVSTHTL